MEENIKELVKKASEGNQQAIAILYERTNKKAYYIAKGYLKDADQAQDILQDAYVKAFANLDSLKEAEKFQGWLDRIVINKCKDYLDKKQPLVFSQLSSEEDSDKTLEFEDESGQFSPEELVDYAETKRLVQEMIDELPGEQRQAILLRYLEDMPVKEIAQIMNCSEGTVKSRLNYGRKAIKDKVLDLEKKGTKLYCMPLTPFLFWLFRQQIEATVVPAAGAGFLAGGAAAAGTGTGVSAGTGASAGASVSAGTSASAGASVSAATGASVSAGTGVSVGASVSAGAGAAAKTGAVIFGKAVSAKAAAVLAAVCVGGGAAGGVYVASQSQKAEQAVVLEESQKESQELSQEPETETVPESKVPDMDVMSYWTKEEKENWEDVIAAFAYCNDFGDDEPLLVSELEPDNGLFTLEIGLNRGLGEKIRTNPESWEPFYPKEELERLAEEYFAITNLEEQAASAWEVTTDGYRYMAGASGLGWADYYSEITGLESTEDRLMITGICGYRTSRGEEAKEGWLYQEAEQMWYQQRPFTAVLRCQPDGEFTKYRLIAGAADAEESEEALPKPEADATEAVSDAPGWDKREKENWESAVAVIGYLCESMRGEDVYTVSVSDFTTQELSGMMQLSFLRGLLPEEYKRQDLYADYYQKDAAERFAREYFGISNLEELAPEMGWTVAENEYQCAGGELGEDEPYCEITGVEATEDGLLVTGFHGLESAIEDFAEPDWVWNERKQIWREQKPFAMKLSSNPQGSFTKFQLEEFADGTSPEEQ